MQAGGGGGGFGAGYLAAKNPEAAGAAVVLLAVGGAIYGVCYAIDAPQRPAIIEPIIEESVEMCANARSNPALYTTDLQSRLQSEWSGTLKELRDRPDFIICMDPDLNDFTIPYDIMQASDDGTKTNHHFGEYRVTGVFYQDNYGPDVLVVKPHSDKIPETSTDVSPDKPHSIKKVYQGVIEGDPSAHSVDVTLSGISASFYIQQDGVVQKQGVSKLSDDDAAFFADSPLIEQIDTYYDLESPL